MDERAHAPPGPEPMVVAIDMGYGHMRAAAALGDALGQPVLACDQPPLADALDIKRWRRWRHTYEWLTRSSATPLGAPLRPLVRMMTAIDPVEPGRDLTGAGWAVRRLTRFARRRGLGARLVELLRATRAPLVTTYFAPAILADLAEHEPIYLVVTDTVMHRIWAPVKAADSRINFCVAGPEARGYLEAYGVRPAQIHETGFPLPPALAAATPRQRAYEARIERLAGGDGPLRVVFAVGGAGTQSDLPSRFLPSLRRPIEDGEITLTLVAGVRDDVRRAFDDALAAHGCTPLLGRGIDVLHRPDLASYFAAFDALLAETDVLWTKPSELSFFAALGLPVFMAEPVGRHENHNRRWLLAHGAAVDAGDPRESGMQLMDARHDGTLAACAEAGFTELPADGTQRIVDLVRG